MKAILVPIVLLLALLLGGGIVFVASILFGFWAALPAAIAYIAAVYFPLRKLLDYLSPEDKL